MSINEFICPKCDQRAIPIKIEHQPNEVRFLITQKCLKHKSKLKIAEVEMSSYLDSLFESTLTCPECQATYPDYKGIEDIISYGMGFNAYLTLKKRCKVCKKTTKLEFNNILNMFYYNSYFNYLKSQETPEIIEKYEDILNCIHCNNKIFINSVMIKNGEGFIECKCFGNPTHKIKYKFPLNEQYTWLSLIPGAINICKKCKSLDVFLKKTDFKYRQGFSTGYLNRRIIVTICNYCGYENVTPMQQGLYEIYRRILKEKEISPTGKGSLTCPACDLDALLEQIQLHPHEIQAVLFCKGEHQFKISLPEKEKSQWINDILSGIKICKYCWSPNQRIWKIEPKIDMGSYGKLRKTKITLQCLDCDKKRSITINNIVYDEFMDFLFD